MLENHFTGYHRNHAFLPLLQTSKLTKHCFSSIQDDPLAQDINGVSGTVQPFLTIFLMTGASTNLTFMYKQI